MRMDYSEVCVPEESVKKLSSELTKPDDSNLPEFVKDVPISVKKIKSKDSVSLEYQWGDTYSDTIKIKKIEFRSDNDLSGIYRVNEKDGTNTLVVKYNNFNYIFRKTTREIALSLYRVYNKLKSSVEHIVGYARSLLGNFYIISKIENICWVFDKKLSGNQHMRTLDVGELEDSERKKLSDLLIEKTIHLHSNNLVIRNFSLDNVMLTNDSVLFTDLRTLRLSRKRTLLVEEFRKLLAYLFRLSLFSHADVYHAAAVYYSSCEKTCTEWYKENTGKNDSGYAVVAAIEKGVC